MVQLLNLKLLTMCSGYQTPLKSTVSAWREGEQAAVRFPRITVIYQLLVADTLVLGNWHHSPPVLCHLCVLLLR